MSKLKNTVDQTYLLNSTQAAEVVGVTASTMARWVRYSRVKSTKVGRWNRFAPKDLTLLLLELYPTKEANRRVNLMKAMLREQDKGEIVARHKA